MITEANEWPIYKTFIGNLLSQGAPIDAIGIVQPLNVKERLDQLSTFTSNGKQIPITVTEYDSVNINENIRADNLEHVYYTAYGHSNVEAD
eukprot:CAMPEP_0168509082 /NCGR_PEP_ID=MMETSP0405-20121227/542_1 /TAXON_ID=498012 /ORGANISM="Trichosphaerium sp, Strain Am-I-7 wt" /LENGTH=90 /DNA_ID=CAMNT_0008526429 /DNA_START=318 /DNA_END=590 /DNA_ORIENTATION=-